ncbi:MAG: agglutinin biogenesis protein MshI [Betaproteobacteria bacterium]|nr:agglutinin biogenesis protein MshI [Betaproteobacteria bacterium]
MFNNGVGHPAVNIGGNRKDADGPWWAVTIDGNRIDVARMASRRERALASFTSVVADGGIVAGLRRCARELGISRGPVSLVLARGEYDTHVLEAPEVPSDELRSAVRWRLKDTLDYPPDEAAVDVLRLPGSAAGIDRRAQVMAVATRAERITAYIDTFDAARLCLKAVDIREMAQRNVSALVEEGEKAVAMISFQGAAGLLTVTARGELHLARAIDVDGDALSGTAAQPHKELVDRIVLEVQRSLDHFDRHSGGLQVARIVVVPFPAATEVRDALAGYVYVPVEILDVGSRLDLTEVPQLRDPLAQGRHLRVIGGALRMT